MINIFKRQSKQSTKEVIAEIHESFYSEVDKLLSDAKISKSLDTSKQELISKCFRLKALGFTNTQEVQEAEKEIERINKIKHENKVKQGIIDAIEFFSIKYPNYKFITEESVKRICYKYNLVYSDIKKYIGTVPDKNLKQIEKFIQITSSNTSALKEYYKGFEQHFGINVELEICAPLKDFNMSQHEIKDFKISKIEIPDPVVLGKVYHRDQKYYLIVTAWGDEANDELVVNQKMN